MPPEVSPTPVPIVWPETCSKDPTCAETVAPIRPSKVVAEGESNMSAFLKLHSVNTTNRALRSSVQNASSLSQSSENLTNDNSSQNSLLVPKGTSSPKPGSRSRSPYRVRADRFSHVISNNDDDIVLPQELYQKLYVSKPNASKSCELSSSLSSSCPFLLLDCRSTKAFKQKHIDGAFNVNCSNKLYCRRLRDGKMSIADLVSSEEGKSVLKQSGSTQTKEIIVYDEDSQHTDTLPNSHPTLLVLSRLRKEGTRASLLKGKIIRFECMMLVYMDNSICFN